MSNHYHLLISTPSENIDDCIQYFQSNFSIWMAKKTGLGAYSFDKRYSWSIVKDPIYYANVYRYTYQNPLRAGMVNLTEEYEYSTLRGRYGLSKLNCPIAPHEYDAGFSSIEENELTWLNTKIPSAESAKIRLGLRRRIYCPPTRMRKKIKNNIKLEKASRGLATGIQ
jgi:putative transposase